MNPVGHDMPETDEPSPSGVGGRAGGNPEGPKPGWWRMLLRWSPVLLLIGAGIVAWAAGLGQYLSISRIVESRAALLDFVDARPVMTALAYGGIYVVAVVLSVPGGALLTMVGGVLYGGALGGVITTAAAVIGSLCVYLIARTSLGGWMRERTLAMGSRVQNLAASFRRNAFYILVLLRIVPIIPYWASNVVSALFGVGLAVFIPATLIGLIPWTVSFAFFGEALNDVVAAQEIANPGCAAAGTCELDFSAVSTKPILIGLAIAAVALIPIASHWWQRRRQGNAEETKPDV